MITPKHQVFLLEQVPSLIQNLKADTQPIFGRMTAQHMVEHLIYVIKVSMKKYGNPDPKLAAHQLNMKKFIAGESGFPKNVTPVNVSPNLKPLKYDNIDLAIAELTKTIKNFYHFYEQHPDFKCYNPHMGELDFFHCERLHDKHIKHHFLQFGLLENN